MRGRGWRAVLCFSPQSCGVPPLFGGDRFSVPHGDSVRHPFGIPGRAGPVLVALRQQAGRAILYHIIFFNYVNFIPRKEAANSFLPMPCICAIRCNRVASARNQKSL